MGVFMKCEYNGLGKIYKGEFKSFFVSKISMEPLPDFRKIYARNRLCRALCGHNIFFVVFSWRKRWDSNPRYVAVQLISSQSRYDHFDTLPNIISHKNATIILYTRKADLSRGFNNLSQKIRNPPKKIKFIDKHRKKSYNLP